MNSIKLTVNGEQFEEQVDNRLLLVDFLRDNLSLTGTHVGCTYEGVCGACTIHLDGDAIKSCMLFAVQANGHTITTVEGLSAGGGLSNLQQAFNDEHGLQCGYCTPGILMNMTDFLEENPNPSDEQIRYGLIGNLCRCTGYVHIIRAVKKAAQMLKDSAPEGQT